jgi:dipeptidyl aminopeptidase/acylaminoacyl peptidase
MVIWMLKYVHDWINNITVPPIPGDKQAYFERSPINFVERFTCPVILFQGLEDPVDFEFLSVCCHQYSFN